MSGFRVQGVIRSTAIVPAGGGGANSYFFLKRKEYKEVQNYNQNPTLDYIFIYLFQSKQQENDVSLKKLLPRIKRRWLIIKDKIIPLFPHVSSL